MKFVFILLAAAATLPTATDASVYTTAELCQILQPCEPPARYDSGPFLAPPIIRDVDLATIQKACGGGGYRAFLGDRVQFSTVMGCAELKEGACAVLVPVEIKIAVPELYALVLRHELGYCRGWVQANYVD